MGSSRDEVSRAYAALDAAFDAVLALDFDAVRPAEKVRLQARMERNLRRAPAVEHRLLAALTRESEPHVLGEASWPRVLSTALRVSSAEAKRRLKRAEVLGPRRAMTGEPLAPLWQATAAAQARGLLDAEHVEVIAKFHKNLPGWVDPDTRAAADSQLARLAAGLGPDDLEAAAARLTAMIDQDGPEPDETERARKRGLTIGKQQADGYSSICGQLDAQARAIWDAIFGKFAAPGIDNPDDKENPVTDREAEDQNPGTDGAVHHDQKRADTRTPAQRRHDAFSAIGRRALASGELGTHNGLPVTVIVSTTLQELQKGAGVAVTGGGSLLPMADLIRLVAPAYHYLYIYDEHSSRSLYLGRTKRLASADQRIVLHARDRGCTKPGCTKPGYWCQVHHAVADWKDHGNTDIDDLTLACGPENRLIENTGWSTRKNAQGHTEWIPPPELDTGQHRINGYHHPERHLLPQEDQGP